VKASENSVPPAEPASHPRLRELVARVKAGDPQAVPALRDFLREEPAIADWLGDVGRLTREAWLNRLVGAEPAVKEAADLRAQERRDELAGPGSPATERLLADLIVNLELEAHEASLNIASTPGGPPAVIAARVRRADSAVRRLLAATRMLRDLQTLLPYRQTPNPRLKVFDPSGQKAM